MRAALLSTPPARPTDDRGIVLAIVLVMIFALVTAVFAFQRRAVIDATIAANRLDAAAADALAKGGLRIAEVLVTIVRAKRLQAGGGAADADADDDGDDGDTLPTLELPLGAAGGSDVDMLWQGIGNLPFELEDGRQLRIEIEDEGAKLNLNALVPAKSGGEIAEEDSEEDTDPEDLEDGEGSSASEEAIEYLTAVIAHVVDGMEGRPESKNYDPAAIAENILDFMDGDRTAIDGRSEDEYYRRQDPPYAAWNRPLLSIDQLGLVEDIDPALLAELRHYATVHPIAGTAGINLNRAEPWVLKLVYSGTSGNKRLIDDRLAGELYELRKKGQLVCDESGADTRCVPLSDVGSGEFSNGSIYPEASLPALPTVFRVVSTARVDQITRRFEAIYDTRPNPGPQLLSWRRLRGSD